MNLFSLLFLNLTAKAPVRIRMLTIGHLLAVPIQMILFFKISHVFYRLLKKKKQSPGCYGP